MARDGRRLWPQQTTIREGRGRGRGGGERKFFGTKNEKKETWEAWHNQGLSSDANLRFSRIMSTSSKRLLPPKSINFSDATLQSFRSITTSMRRRRGLSKWNE